MIEKLQKYWGFLALIIGGLVGVYGWIYNQGTLNAKFEGRTFDSPDQKVYVVKKVEELPTPEQEQRKYFQDSINTASAIKSRRKRDSLWLLEHKARMRTDSINRLNADQLFQIKEELKKIKSQQ